MGPIKKIHNLCYIADLNWQSKGIAEIISDVINYWDKIGLIDRSNNITELGKRNACVKQIKFLYSLVQWDRVQEIQQQNV